MKSMRRLISLISVCALCLCLPAYAVEPTFQASADNHYSVISGGMSHTLAVKSDGTVWGWGSNESGQLAKKADATESRRAVEIKGVTAVSVAAGFNFSAALKYDGMVYTWGNGIEEPTPVPGLSEIVSIAAGQTDMLALKHDGTVWQWTVAAGAAPKQVAGLTDIIAVSVGGGHYLALSVSGEVWAWGRNDQGQLGLDDTADHAEPMQVQGLMDVVNIAAGYSHSLAITFDGAVYAWGANTYGQLGDSTTENRTVPVKAKTIKKAVQVAAGNDTSMAITEEGQIYTWGYGEYGQLGHTNPSISQIAPRTADDVKIKNPIAIACGLYHNILVNAKGDVFTWGRNKNNQLGTGSETNAETPQSAFRLVSEGEYTLGIYTLDLFEDLNSWSKPEVSVLYDTHLVSPLLWRDFGDRITRAEFAHLLVDVYEQVRHNTNSPGSAEPFKDISKHVLREDIVKAHQLGFIDGRSETTFAPDENLTRQEAAKMFCNLLAKLQNVTIPTDISSLAYYSDAAMIGEWAVPFVAYTYRENIMRGTSDRFNPQGWFTREQSLLTMARLVERYDWAG